MRHSRRGLLALLGGTALAPMLPAAAAFAQDNYITPDEVMASPGCAPRGTVVVNFQNRQFVFAKGGTIHFTPERGVWAEGCDI